MAPLPFSKVVFYYLWIAPHVLLLGIAAAMLWRKLRPAFPLFFTYIVFEILQFGVLFVLSFAPTSTAETYFYVYSTGLACSTALRFGLIHEIFAHLFRDYPSFSRFGKPMFRWILAGTVLGAVLLTLYAGGNTSDHEWYVMNVLNHTALILQAGLLFTLFMFSWYLNLSWRYPIFGIALGFGVFVSMEVIETAIRFKTGFTFATSLGYLSMGIWHGCVLLWLFYLWAPARKPHSEVSQLPDHVDLEAWNRELKRLIHQ